MTDKNSTGTKIHCDAKNCVYHTDDCCCSAGAISVGCRNACSCGETNCATFKLNNEALYKT